MKVCATDTAGNLDITKENNTNQTSSRLAYLLGEVRRQKNGAVADFMRFYGERYGLNYGVSLSTVRELARDEALAMERVMESATQRHKFAKLLYKQEVRELRLIALWIADIELIISNNETDFWGRGVINSEVAEEAAFALIHRSDLFDCWLDSESTLLQYSAVMALAKRASTSKERARNCINSHSTKLLQLIDKEPHIIPKAVVALLDSALKSGVEVTEIHSFLSNLPKGSGSNYITEEITWRLEFQ